jgi:hypothetical protein
MSYYKLQLQICAFIGGYSESLPAGKLFGSQTGEDFFAREEDS